MMLDVLLVCLVVAAGVSSHPQCLDFLPPFASSRPLTLCDQYADFGCCSLSRDTVLHKTSTNDTDLQAALASDGNGKCTEYWRNVTCLQCSPYAAHLYDAEGTGTPRQYPGLCTSYCTDLFANCPNLARFIAKPNQPQNAEEFCELTRLSDASYCYPGVLDVDTSGPTRKRGDLGCVCVREVIDGLRNPVVLTHAGDGSNRLFIAEQVGVVYVHLSNGSILSEPFMDIQTKILTSSRRGDERGFLGMAFHPNHSTNGHVFVYYSTYDLDSNHVIRVARYSIEKENPNKIDHLSEKTIIEVSQPAGNHNGGEILFGFDGYLYLFLGDGGKGGDPWGSIGNGLDKSTLLGSVLRLDVDSNPDVPYTIPPDNPFIDEPNSRAEIYAYGLRNPWRCALDSGDRETGRGRGRIFCGDVGQNRYEEVDIIVKGGNHGWRAKEGLACYDSTLCSQYSNAISPIHVYDHSVGKSVTGGFVYRGCAFPNLYGKYIFGDYTSGRLFGLTEGDDGKWMSEDFCLGDETVCNTGLVGSFPKNILSFGEDESGELYLLATDYASPSHKGGKVYQLVDPARRNDPSQCDESDLTYPETQPDDALGN
ncbi:HHIP-like protein 2 isoform X2 [Oscarella lobularis]|uniref:HHIP-like protein 2 isoform X2 n=1 Tax=Oscarella lobularis TaxID=121494 RepID=UPI00331354C2